MPLAWLYGGLAARNARRQTAKAATNRLPVPVLVVGNFVAGGAGKTPTVVAVARALQAAGHRPGILSRGHGRQAAAVHRVDPSDSPEQAGDEPLLIHRLTGMPVWVGADRVAAARALCACHPEVDVLISDDGLQHRALPRQAELIVFDRRGAGNGLLLPAGPLREPMPTHLAPHQRVLYTAGVASTPLPGLRALPKLAGAWPLAAWARRDHRQLLPLTALSGRPLLAAAGLAAPEKFFAMLEQAGLTLERLPLPDHYDYRLVPWPPGTPDVVVTEKDAIKLQAADNPDTRIWVVPLDLQLPPELMPGLLELLGLPLAHPAPPPPSTPSAPAP
jgi:tetraacyldisaccharide 4'-kinase